MSLIMLLFINKNNGYHFPSIPSPNLLICSDCCPNPPDPDVVLLQLLDHAEALLMWPIQPVLPFAGPSLLIYSPTARALYILMTCSCPCTGHEHEILLASSYLLQFLCETACGHNPTPIICILLSYSFQTWEMSSFLWHEVVLYFFIIHCLPKQMPHA
jgi:hypothetical protein